ncbi:MAG: ATP-binding protein [Thermodesulfobacteriota bacterium]
MENSVARDIQLLKRFTVAATVVWTIILGSSLAWNIYHAKRDTLAMAKHAARAYFDKDQAFRLWATSHGGVYVPIDEQTPPNPNLAHVPERDISTPSGKKLTLMNPAYMIRQLMEQYAALYGVKGRITSLKVLNPVNEPDAWERAALKAFEQGVGEVFEVADLGGQPFLRLIRPMITQQGCLKCHARQGYKVGDVRGGVGVAVPMEPYLALYQDHRTSYFITHALVWALGLGVLFFLANRGEALIISRGELAEEREKVAEQMRLILESLREGVFGLDKHGRATFVNPAAAQMLLYPPEELLDRNMHAQVHHSTADGAPYPDEICPHSKTLRDGTFEEVEEDQFWRKDGMSFPVRSKSSPIHKNGEVVGAVVTFTDVSIEQEKKVLENQLRQAQKMEAIGTLAGGIAHDFNNILTPILGYAELVQDHLKSESDLWQQQQEIIKAGKRAKDLVAQILSFSRQTEHELTPVSLSSLLKEVVKLLRASIPSTVEIRLSTSPECGMILADPTQVHQVIMNLSTNAYHAMRERGGVLDISLSPVTISPDDVSKQILLEPGRHLRLSVSDTGCGMDRSVMEKIFEPYFTTKPKGEGTGLGLSVVHAIVRNHGGAITAYSEVGKGTTFHVYFPEVGEAVQSKEEGEVAPLATGGGERVLVVDDEQEIVDLMRRLLEGLGYRTILMHSSLGALDYLKEHHQDVDLVITDMSMPHLSGTQLARQVKELRPDMPVILCSGFSKEINAETARAAGVDRYLMKPVVKRELAEALQSLLGKCG